MGTHEANNCLAHILYYNVTGTSQTRTQFQYQFQSDLDIVMGVRFLVIRQLPKYQKVTMSGDLTNTHDLPRRRYSNTTTTFYANHSQFLFYIYFTE